MLQLWVIKIAFLKYCLSFQPNTTLKEGVLEKHYLNIHGSFLPNYKRGNEFTLMVISNLFNMIFVA